MADNTAGGRRGRPEGRLGTTVPEHRRVLAQRLRDLRAECGGPPYRVLSGLAHCAAGTLSEAAGGRRLPTWETTRAYVTGCLRHAGREDEVAAALPRWRAAWERARRAEERAATPPAPVRPAPVARRRPRWRFLIAAALVLLAGAAAPVRELIAPAGFTIVLAAQDGPGGEEVRRSLDRALSAWAEREPRIRVRSVAVAPARLETIAADLGADVVVRPAPGARTVQILVAGRAFAQTPEFAGRHDVSRSAPPSALAATARGYLGGVADFAAGLAAYDRAELPAAETAFRAAWAQFGTASPERRAVIEAMVGTVVGAQDPVGAQQHFRRALYERPGYGRAEVGLADVLRASAGCDAPRTADPRRLTEAEATYRQFLRRSPEQGAGPVDPLLQMTARLGIGLVAQCRSLAGRERGWARADEEFNQVLLLRRAAVQAGTPEPQARYLAAEARAGLGVDALAGHREYAEAAANLEEALDLLAGVAGTRVAYLERERVFLQHLRICYHLLGRFAEVSVTQARLDRVDQRLARLPAPPR